MAKIPVWNWKKEQVGEVALPAERLRVPVPPPPRVGGRQGVPRGSARRERTRRRSAPRSSGSGKKPFKQKGTGRARQGGGRPPIHRHGGTVHGPVPRSYAQGVSVGEKKNALKAVLSRRAAE